MSPDGERVLFLRSQSGNDPQNSLWEHKDGNERQIVDPALLIEDDDVLTQAEKVRRERARESGDGIVSYATDTQGTLVAFALAGRLFTVNLNAYETTAHDPPKDVFDPRPNPAGTHVAYISERALRIAGVDGGDMKLAGEDDPQVSWGTADFLAAEEMQRARGFWWSPEGDSILATRVDTNSVSTWNICDPNHPETPSREIRYPYAGSELPITRAFILSLRGSRREVVWDRLKFPYLASVSWAKHGCVLTVQNRRQNLMQILSVDTISGSTSLLKEISDPSWLEITPGLPAWLGGQLVTAGDSEETRRLYLGEMPVTPAGVQLRRVLGEDSLGLVFVASPEPSQSHIYRLTADGEVRQLTNGLAVNTGAVGGDTIVIVGATLDQTKGNVGIYRDENQVATIASYGEVPNLVCSPKLEVLGERDLVSAVLFPEGHVQGNKLPVLLDPYGGPHAQRVQANQRQFLTSQWFANQGFAVIVSDGRGTPARGTSWERAVDGDFASAVLQDQIDALGAAAQRYADLDTKRVGIRGWSFGGYLAALAVLKRPDLFHAAVAGAPVTDWAFYDTHYTERYLGLPEENPQAYERSSLLPLAPELRRPLLMIHGLADDNVLSVHTLRLSEALMVAGRLHQVLPLSGISHMTPQAEVAENLLHIQVSFLKESLRAPAAS